VNFLGFIIFFVNHMAELSLFSKFFCLSRGRQFLPRYRSQIITQEIESKKLKKNQ